MIAKKIFILVFIFFSVLKSLKADGLYYGYYQQTQNGTWQGYINSPITFSVENNSIVVVNPKNQGIVYITPSNYVILLNYGGQLAEPVPIVLNSPFNFSFQKEYYMDGNLVLTAEFNYSGFYYQDYLEGNLVLNVVAINPSYKPYQGIFYFSFLSGIISASTDKYVGYYVQKNNGNWNKFINSPFNITITDNKITFWNELNKDIVYIRSQSQFRKLPFGLQFAQPIPVTDGIPFHIEFTNYYMENGQTVLTENFTIDGTKNGFYIYGSMIGEIVALNPDYNSYQGTYLWDFEAGIERDIICEYGINPKNQLVSSNGGTYNFEVIAENECYWEIIQDVDWISNFSSSSGYGSAIISYFVLPNTEGIKRTGNIFLKDINGTVHSSLKVDESNLDCPKELNYYQVTGYPSKMAISGNYVYISSYEGGLRIFDVSNPLSPYEVGYFDDFIYSVDLEISENIAYLADLDNGVLILNISNPSSPNLLGQYYDYSSTFCIAISGNYVFIGTPLGKFKIVDVSNPQLPQKVGELGVSGAIRDIAISGNYAYLACEDYGLKILDISNPANPFQICTYDTQGWACSLFVQGDYCYLIDGDLRIINISNPYSPQEIYVYHTASCFYSIDMYGNYAYLLHCDLGLLIMDISDIYEPKEIGCYFLQNCPIQVMVYENLSFILDGNGGFQLFDLSCIMDCQINLGDVNENYSITSLDGSYLLQYIVGLGELSESQKCKADVNLNGSITSLDASDILKCVIGFCNGLPAEFLLSCQNHNNCL